MGGNWQLLSIVQIGVYLVELDVPMFRGLKTAVAEDHLRETDSLFHVGYGHGKSGMLQATGNHYE